MPTLSYALSFNIELVLEFSTKPRIFFTPLESFFAFGKLIFL